MSGGRKKRSDLAKGQAQFDRYAGQAIDLQRPYAELGQPAANQLSYLSGLGSPEQQQQANNAFTNSLFYQGGQNAFGLEKDAIDAGLSSQGLLYSQARLNAVEDARQRNFQNAFAQYLGNTGNVANIGLGATNNTGNILMNQGNAALGTAGQQAATRQGFLGTLGQITGIGANIANAYKGFS